VGVYHDRSRQLQDRFDTRRLADRLEESVVRDHIRDADRAFIEARDMFFLATADASGRPQCSYKGGDPGFVRVLDEHTLAGCTTSFRPATPRAIRRAKSSEGLAPP
jgi:predicted pyridoxine 5'-phosphate oxidase superfamily flavin-nucleotide-binding protein